MHTRPLPKPLLAAIAIGTTLAPSAHADLTLDLRFAGANKIKYLSAADNGSSVTTFVFARVTGTLGSATQFTALGLSSAVIMAASYQPAGSPLFVGTANGYTTPFILNPAFAGSASSTAGANANPAAFPTYNPIGLPNALADFGSPAPANTALQTFAAADQPVFGGGSVGAPVNPANPAQGWEFPLGSFSFAFDSVFLAYRDVTLTISLRTPTNFAPATMAAPGNVHALWWEDGSNPATHRRSARGFQSAPNNGTPGNDTAQSATFAAATPIRFRTFTNLGTSAPGAVVYLTSTAESSIADNNASLPGAIKGTSTTPGSIKVLGSRTNFVSEIDALTGPAFDHGSADIDGLYSLDPAADVYAMLWLVGSPSDIASLLLTLQNNGPILRYDIQAQPQGPITTQWTALQSNYGNSPLGNFGFLVRFNNPGAPLADGAFNFDFTGTNVTLQALAIVPEPPP